MIAKKTEVRTVEPVKTVQPDKSIKEVEVADGERQQSAAAVVVPKNEDRIKKEPVKLAKPTGAKIASAKSVEPVAKKLDSKSDELQVAKLEDTTSKVETTAKQLTRKLIKNDSKKVPEKVTPTKQEAAVVAKPEPVVERTTKPSPEVEKISKPVQVVKSKTSSQPHQPVVAEKAKAGHPYQFFGNYPKG